MNDVAQGARFATIFEAIASSEAPRAEDVRAGFDAILAGAWTPVQVAGFAVALRLRGQTAEVLGAGAAALRAVMIPVEHGLSGVVDTCGTGGDGKGTLNVSTLAAFVVAACGHPVAKHGNRSVSSRAGSADLLEALGLPLELPAHAAAALLRDVGVAFLFAPAHHPAMRHGSVARRELGVRTIFNALGPLVNPARAEHQLVGAYDDALRPLLARALEAGGVKRAWVVRGDDGLDEVSPFSPTRVTALDGGELREFTVTPRDFGFEPSAAGALDGEGAKENAAAATQILRGEPHPARNAVALNAAAALAVARGVRDAAGLAELGREASAALAEGRGFAVFEKLRDRAAELVAHAVQAGIGVP